MSNDPHASTHRLGLETEAALALGLARQEFDYAAVERTLGTGDEADAPEPAIPPEVLEGFRAALSIFVDTVIPPEGRCPTPLTIGIRVLALLQLVRPEALAGKSLNEIARETGITRAALSKTLVAYSDTFQFCARFQRAHKHRKTYADVQRTVHARRRQQQACADAAPNPTHARVRGVA